MIGTVVRRLALAVLVAIGVGGVLLVGFLLRGGVSARPEPSAAEALLARRLRHWAIPRDMRERLNPLPATPEIVAEGRAHFADHCALCHANDGGGDTEIGRGLYPQGARHAPAGNAGALRRRALRIIKNGVRLTGMPAWGSDRSGRATKRLGSSCTSSAIFPRSRRPSSARCRSSTPRARARRQEEREEREFLEGH